MTTMKRVLVTGGAGFIGSHLCERLLDDGADVLCVDNYFTGSKANIAHLMGNPHFEIMRHDVTFPSRISLAWVLIPNDFRLVRQNNVQRLIRVNSANC